MAKTKRVIKAGLSKKILINPTKALQSGEYARLLTEDPDFLTIHPLARAIVLLAQSRPADAAILAECFREGLKGATLSGQTHVRLPDPPDPRWTYAEKVRHVVEVCWNETPLALHFESDGELKYYEPRYNPEGMVYRVELSQLLRHAAKERINPPEYPTQLHAWWSACADACPQIVGSYQDVQTTSGITHTLVRINTKDNDLPSAINPKAHFYTGTDKKNSNKIFSFLDALREDDAHALGLAGPPKKRGRKSSNEKTKAPAPSDSGAYIIGGYELDESYRNAPLWFDVLTLDIPQLVSLPIQMDGDQLEPNVIDILKRIIDLGTTIASREYPGTALWRRIHAINAQLEARAIPWDLSQHTLNLFAKETVSYLGDKVTRHVKLGHQWTSDVVVENTGGRGTCTVAIETDVAELLQLVVAKNFCLPELRWRDLRGFSSMYDWTVEPDQKGTAVSIDKTRVIAPSGRIFTLQESIHAKDGNPRTDLDVRYNISVEQEEDWGDGSFSGTLLVDITTGTECLNGRFAFNAIGDFYQLMPEDVNGPADPSVFTYDIEDTLEEVIEEGDNLLRGINTLVEKSPWHFS